MLPAKLRGVALHPLALQALRHSRRQSTATVHALTQALLDPHAVVVDLRPAHEAESINGTFSAVAGSRSAVWDGMKMPIDSVLPQDRSIPLILHCRSGKRATAAASFLAEHGFTNITNGGGPATAALWQAFGNRRREYKLLGMQQLFDDSSPGGTGSSTFTYVLADNVSGEALLIDPVLEHVHRDLAILETAGLKLRYVLNTHVHADHITGSGELKKLSSCLSVLSQASGGKADLLVEHGATIEWASGRRKLEVLATPGHTNGCVSFYDKEMRAVFSGDALLIQGCGRTDFQEGNAATLFNAVHNELFALPEDTLVFPAHEYKQRSYSTIGLEKLTNPRFTLSEEDFVMHMANLQLSEPELIDVAVPRNLNCGA